MILDSTTTICCSSPTHIVTFDQCHRSIYTSIVAGHLACGNFEASVSSIGQQLVDASIELHRGVMTSFLPSAVKFHYQFNLRELSALAQVLLPCYPSFRHAAGCIALYTCSTPSRIYLVSTHSCLTDCTYFTSSVPWKAPKTSTWCASMVGVRGIESCFLQV